MNDQPEKSARHKQIEERRKRVADLNPRVERIRVNPRDDTIRKALMHPIGRLKFPESGSVEWPLDQFTRRRLRDGTVTRAEGGSNRRRQQQPDQPKT